MENRSRAETLGIFKSYLMINFRSIPLWYVGSLLLPHDIVLDVSTWDRFHSGHDVSMTNCLNMYYLSMAGLPITNMVGCACSQGEMNRAVAKIDCGHISDYSSVINIQI